MPGLRSILRRLLGWDSAREAEPAPVRPATSAPALAQAGSPEPVRRRVLMVVHDPYVDRTAGRTLRQARAWNDPDRLAREYIAAVQRCSHGYANYEVVERLEGHEFPRKVDGFRYDAASYQAARRPQDYHQPDQVDYLALVRQFGIIEKVRSGAIDEAWLFGFPYAGYWESTMGGPGAFWCNSEPVPHTEQAGRRFVIMGFNFERGVAEMLEDLGHRAESILEQVFARKPADANLYRRFIRYERQDPGRAECGTVHYPPNGRFDYDWDNPGYVLSRCDTWLDFPDLHGEPRRVNCAEWGCAMRGKHEWWLSHLPHVAGRADGISWNWWEYIVDPNAVDV